MDNPVQIDDLVPRFRPFAEAEQAEAQDLLDDAWQLVQGAAGVEDRLTSGALREGTVKTVIKGMVLRVLRNRDGIRQFSSDQATYVRDNAVSSGELYLSAADLALLSESDSGTGSAAAFTIRPVGRAVGRFW